jgi:hypothetical protein
MFAWSAKLRLITEQVGMLLAAVCFVPTIICISLEETISTGLNNSLSVLQNF